MAGLDSKKPELHQPAVTQRELNQSGPLKSRKSHLKILFRSIFYLIFLHLLALKHAFSSLASTAEMMRNFPSFSRKLGGSRPHRAARAAAALQTSSGCKISHRCHPSACPTARAASISSSIGCRCHCSQQHSPCGTGSAAKAPQCSVLCGWHRACILWEESPPLLTLCLLKNCPTLFSSPLHQTITEIISALSSPPCATGNGRPC